MRTREDVVRALARPVLAPLLAALSEVADGDWHLYDVIDVDPPQRERRR